MESSGSTTSRNMIQTLEDNNSTTEIGIQRIQSFESKTGLESGETIHKTKLLSSGCSININELVRGASRTFDHVTGSFPGRTFSNELVSSVSVPAAAFPLDKSSDNATSQEDSDSSSWSKTQIEPSLPICLKFEDVKYKAPAKKMKSSGSEKYIIQGITGSVHPGEVLALMGTSGGGKTTLLNLLSGRVKFNSGTITYNDRPYTRSLKRRIGFVMQDDVAFPHLTVKETLTYAALLHLPSTLTSQQKKGRAMDVINELGLERCQNTMIGGAFVRGISGGERKRVCIGTEILLNPSLLFLDEPTSGLDSTTALRIVQMLQDIAKSGKTVVTTIHQPSSRLFSMFDKLILLGKGSSLYFGKASEAMLYFSSIGCSPLIAMNPAEFLIDLANGNINDKSVPLELEEMTCPGEDKGPCEVLVHEYLVEAYAATIASPEKTKALKPVVIKGEPEMQGGFNSMEWGATWWEQFSILSRRGLKERRHHYFSNMRVVQVLAIAIITGLLWWHSDASSHEDLKDQGGLLFFISVFWGFFPLFTSIFIFPQERAMLVKERSVGMYKLSAYFVARNISDLPLDLILPIVFVAIVYLMGGLKHSFPAFSLTMLTIFLSIVAAQGLGLAIGAACKDLKKATILASVIVMTFMLAGGFFIEEVPPFMSWARYISFTYHTYRLLLRIQYGCSGSDPKSGSCKSPFRGLKLDRPGIEISAIIAMIIGYRLLAYIILGRMKLRTGT